MAENLLPALTDDGEEESGIAISGIAQLFFPKEVGLADFKNMKTVLPLLQKFSQDSGKRKFSLADLAGALRIPGATVVQNQVSYSVEQTELVRNLSMAIEDEPDDEKRKDLWDLLGYTTKYEMLIPEVDSINITLYELLNVDADMVRKAFITKNALAVPHWPDKGSVKYGILDEVVSEQFATILRMLPREDVCEILRNLNPGVLYLLVALEVDHFVCGDDQRIAILCALKYDDIVPAECPFLALIQEYSLNEVFVVVKENFFNQDFPESRSQYYELNQRLFGEKAPLYGGDSNYGEDDEYIEQILDLREKNAD